MSSLIRSGTIAKLAQVKTEQDKLDLRPDDPFLSVRRSLFQTGMGIESNNRPSSSRVSGSGAGGGDYRNYKTEQRRQVTFCNHSNELPLNNPLYLST